jgi:dihydroxyacetone kinase-like protein
MLDVLERWLRVSAERIRDQAPALTALDQAIGDGDHGINMDRGFSTVVAALDAGCRTPRPSARAGLLLTPPGARS